MQADSILGERGFRSASAIPPGPERPTQIPVSAAPALQQLEISAPIPNEPLGRLLRWDPSEVASCGAVSLEFHASPLARFQGMRTYARSIPSQGYP